MKLRRQIVHSIGWYALAVPICLAGASVAQGKPTSAKAIVERHTRDYVNGDRQALLDGYADDIVMIRHGAVVKGKADLAAIIARIDFAGQEPLRIDRITVDGDVAIENWTRNAGKPNATRGRDVFILRGGKIVVQITD